MSKIRSSAPSTMHMAKAVSTDRYRHLAVAARQLSWADFAQCSALALPRVMTSAEGEPPRQVPAMGELPFQFATEPC